MDGLSRRDLAAALDFIDGAYAANDPERLARYTVVNLLSLLRSDCAAFNEINARRRRIQWVTEGAQPPGDGEQIFAAHMHTHPVVAHFKRPGTGAATRVSDVLSRREWLGRGIYTEFYRPMGLDAFMGINVTRPGSLFI